MSHADKIYDAQNHTARWYSRASLEAGTELPARAVQRALWDLRRAESRGFSGCWAVFEDFRYDGLDEAISDTQRAAGGGWGRGQDVTYRNTVGPDGNLVRDPDYPEPPPSWTGEREGYACEIIVNHSASRCGYVTVRPGHPAFGKGYDDLNIDVHGGLTYACAAEDGGWTFGFDCSHCDDAGHPEYERGQRQSYGFGHDDGVYRTEEYVVAEIETLAKQLKAMESPVPA